MAGKSKGFPAGKKGKGMAWPAPDGDADDKFPKGKGSGKTKPPFMKKGK